MPANPDLLQKLQFNYKSPDADFPFHRMEADLPGFGTVGHLDWTSRGIRAVGVAQDIQRQGVATALYNSARAVARTNRRVPQPRHSSDRTTAGTAWAKSVGGRLPRQPKAAMRAFDKSMRNLNG